jgi:hypothetical protein
MAIREAREGGKVYYVMSANRVWRPGVFDSPRTARIAQRCDDEEISRFQQVANSRMPDGFGGIVTEQLIRELKQTTQVDS